MYQLASRLTDILNYPLPDRIRQFNICFEACPIKDLQVIAFQPFRKHFINLWSLVGFLSDTGAACFRIPRQPWLGSENNHRQELHGIQDAVRIFPSPRAVFPNHLSPAQRHDEVRYHIVSASGEVETNAGVGSIQPFLR